MTLPTGPLAPLLPSWQRHLRAKDASKNTISTYMQGAIRLDAFMAHLDDPADITRADLERWRVHLLNTGSAATASNRWRAAKQLFKWLTAEDEIPADPTAGMAGIKVTDQPPDVVTLEQFRQLLAGCDTTFEGIRDRAILMLFYDSGVRLGGLVGLRVDDVDLETQTARVVLKGGKEHDIPFGVKAADALDRYIRARRKHPKAHLLALWVHRRGAMNVSGVQTMIRRRAERAGIPHVHPHQFRHTFSHNWLEAGGGEGDLMEIAGWTDPTMARRYGRSVAGKRARNAHKKFSPGDKV